MKAHGGGAVIRSTTHGAARRALLPWALASVCLCLLLAAVLPAGTARAGSAYIDEVVRGDPAILRAWQHIVPKSLARHRWLYALDGVTDDLSLVSIGGKPYYLGWVCIPHDCGGNETAFLIATDASRAMGAVKSATHGIKLRFMGSPDAEAKAILLKKFSS